MKSWIFVQFCTAWRRRKHQEKLTNTVAPPVHKGQLAGKFYIRKKYVYSATSFHTLLFFIKSLSEPEWSTWANHASWESYYG